MIKYLALSLSLILANNLMASNRRIGAGMPDRTNKKGMLERLHGKMEELKEAEKISQYGLTDAEALRKGEFDLEKRKALRKCVGPVLGRRGKDAAIEQAILLHKMLLPSPAPATPPPAE